MLSLKIDLKKFIKNLWECESLWLIKEFHAKKFENTMSTEINSLFNMDIIIIVFVYVNVNSARVDCW